MPTNLTGINGGTFNNIIPAPVDGEAVDGASVQQVGQAAANQDKFLYDTKGNLDGGNSWTGEQTFGDTVNMVVRTRIGGHKDLTTTDHILYDSVTDGLNYIRMLAKPTANRAITLPQPVAWAGSTAYTSGVSSVKNGGKVYFCITSGTSAASGGPTGTGADITDGTVHWSYQGLAPIAGDWFEISVFVADSAFTVQVGREGSAEWLAFLGPGVATGDMASAKVWFDGTRWKLLSVGGTGAKYGDESNNP